MRKQLYLALIERIKTLQDDSGLPIIQHFDLWNEQVEYIEQETPFQTPAVFFEFGPMEWRSLGSRRQECAATFALHIITRYDGSPADGYDTQEQALAMFDLIDAVNRTIVGYSGDGFGSIDRVKSVPNHNHAELIDNIEIYTTRLIDTTAETVTRPHPVPPKIDMANIRT